MDLIFIFYQEGDTATYYWGLTIANSGLELFNLIYVGIFPLFTKYIKLKLNVIVFST